MTDAGGQVHVVAAALHVVVDGEAGGPVRLDRDRPEAVPGECFEDPVAQARERWLAVVGLTDREQGALNAYVALLPGYGHRAAGEIMKSVLRDDLPSALASSTPPPPGPDGPVSVGVLAHRLGVTPATLRKWERAGILAPARSRTARAYSPDDVRDAELAHLLRRGGYLLDRIAAVIEQVRAAGGPGLLAASIEQWRERITARGRAMLTGSARLADYLSFLEHTHRQLRVRCCW